jgi:hypothetical protein
VTFGFSRHYPKIGGVETQQKKEPTQSIHAFGGKHEWAGNPPALQPGPGTIVACSGDMDRKATWYGTRLNENR